MVVFPHRRVSPRGYMGLWGMLDESPGVSFLHGFTAGGDPEPAVDGFDLGSYGAWGDVEALRNLPGGEISYEEAKHIELPLRELPVELPLPRLASAELPFLTLQKLEEHTSVRVPLQHGSRLGEHRSTSGSIAALLARRGEGKQSYDGGPGTQAGQLSSHGKGTLQLPLGLLQLSALG